MQNSIDSKYGKHKYKGLFSQVSDENIEKNIPLARSVVESGVKNHRIATQNPDNLSKLIGGLAVFYAASDENKFSIADKAREAAYMDDKKDYGKHSERQATKKDKKKASLLHENMKQGFADSGYKNETLLFDSRSDNVETTELPARNDLLKKTSTLLSSKPQSTSQSTAKSSYTKEELDNMINEYKSKNPGREEYLISADPFRTDPEYPDEVNKKLSYYKQAYFMHLENEWQHADAKTREKIEQAAAFGYSEYNPYLEEVQKLREEGERYKQKNREKANASKGPVRIEESETDGVLAPGQANSGNIFQYLYENGYYSDVSKQLVGNRVNSNTPEYLKPRQENEPLRIEHQTQKWVDGKERNACCVVTCCAMMLNYYGAKITAKEAYIANGGYRVYYDKIFEKTGLKGKINVEKSQEGIPETSILEKCAEELKEGNPVMVEIKYYRDGEWCQHSVVVYGMTGDGTKASDFLAMDPYRDDANNPGTGKLNTLQDSKNMFKNENEYLNMWRVFRITK